MPTAGAAAASVNVSVTPINPALDVSVMPGDYTAVLAGGGAAVPIESFGALLIDVRDDSGTRYTLGTGKTASVRIPVGTLSAAPPASIPMLIFDASTGRWTEDGVAVLEGTAPNQAYVGTVARFGNWNADQKMNTVVVSSCVRDTTNQPVVNAIVKSEGINYSGTATTYTDAAGNFGVAVRRDALATLSVTFLDRDSKPVTKTVNVGPYAADFTLSPCIDTVPALLQISARPLPRGVVGTPYSARLVASNGTKPYAWSFSGALPTGLTLDNTTGQISGTPITGGTFSGRFQVQNSSAPAQTASTPFSITVITPPSFAISTPALPSGVVNTAYTASLSAANGTTPYTWSVLTGNVPTGLILDSATGQISGMPSVAGTFTFTIQAQDSSATVKTASRPFTVVIAAPASLPVAPTGVAAAPGNTLVNISWSPVSGATSYNLYMASVAGVTKSNYATLTGGMKHTGVTSAYIHTGLTNGTTYYFVVTALNANGESVESSEVSAKPTVVITPPPSGGTVATGSQHACALMSKGTVWCWGSNSIGQFGNGNTTSSSTPVVVSGITSATAIAAGGGHTCAILSNGTVQCWGYNGIGQLGNGTTTNSSTPVTVSGITTAAALAAGSQHTCALMSNGTVQCWGDNGQGQLGNGTSTSSFTPVTVSGITTATDISAGINHTCAVLGNGTVQCWGNNGSGKLGNGTATSSNGIITSSSTPVTVSGITTATDISAGINHTCAVLGNGTVQCWGSNYSGQLGNGTTTDSSTPVTVSSITTATAIAAGGYLVEHSCAVLSNGTVQCWGANAFGQLGNGTTTNSSIPVTVSGTAIASAIATGGAVTCIVLSNGTVQCWGYNAYGQLGNGTTTNSSIPVPVIGLPSP